MPARRNYDGGGSGGIGKEGFPKLKVTNRGIENSKGRETGP